MKMLFLILLISATLGDACFAQVMKKKMNTTMPVNSAVKAIPAQSTQKKPPVFLKEKFNGKYHSNAIPLLVFSKTINYNDKSKLHIGLMKNPKFAGQPDHIAPQNSQPQTSDSGDSSCTTQVVKLSATSSTFMNNNYELQEPHIYPGAIYTYPHLYDGSFKEENQNRNPICIGSENPNMRGSTYEEVTNPNSFTIHDAIAKLYGRFVGPSANESTSIQVSEYSNTSDLSLKIGVGGSGYGVSVSNVFSTANTSQHYYMAVDARKILFSMSASIPDSGYFKTPQGNTPMVVMNTVSYGVRVLANLDFTFQSQEDFDKFKASYSGFGTYDTASLSYLSKNTSLNSTINCYVIGGPSDGTTISFNKAQLESGIRNILNGATYYNSRPISYQLMDLDGSVVGSSSATDQFAIRTCVLGTMYIDQPPSLTIKTGYSPGDNKDGNTHYSVGLYDQPSGGNSVASYHDNSDNDAYAEGTTHYPVMSFQTSRRLSNKSFPNGGHVHINVAPDGHDTWKIDEFDLTIKLGDVPKTMTWRNIVLAQDARDIDLPFDASFNTPGNN